MEDETDRCDALHTDSMHPQQDNIRWDEDYDSPGMRAYPLLPVVCVRGNMGVGKTRQLLAMVRDRCSSDSKALVVTFSRALAAKLHSEFAPLGFVDYLAQRGPVTAPKVVVCLDSLWRVTTREFDFVFVDEAVSVFLHLNSPLMTHSVENTALLQQAVIDSQHAYFLDACLDTTFVKQIVEYFSEAKGTGRPHWIRNRYVRPTNRVVRCHVRYGNVFASAGLQKLAMARVLSLLRSGKRVVVCSSTKKFTIALQDNVRDNRPGTSMAVYNGDTGGIDLADVDRTWSAVDLLVYSPSITAGVSFEAPHFDSLVAYFANSAYTPGVDIALQQLFRVRSLGCGDMSLYVADACPDEALPSTDAQVERMLQDDAVDVSKLIAGGVDPKADRLSHLVVKGIVTMRNRSASNYTAILLRTLREDYGIRCVRVDSFDRDVDEPMPAFEVADPVPFEEAKRLMLSYGAQLLGGNTGAANVAARRLYHVATRLWGVPAGNIDAAFSALLVTPADAGEIYLRAKRYRLLALQSLAANRQELDLCPPEERKSVELLLRAQAAMLSAGAAQKSLKALRPVRLAVPDDKVDAFSQLVSTAFGMVVRPCAPGIVEATVPALKRIKDSWAPRLLTMA